MEYCCVARKKSINCEKIKAQTVAVTVINCGFDFFFFACHELYFDWFSTQLTFQNQIKVFTVF